MKALSDCKICHGLSLSRCMMCGKKRKPKKDMTPMEIITYDAHVEHVEYLRKLYNKMKALKMKTTGCETLDKEVRDKIGNWDWEVQ